MTQLTPPSLSRFCTPRNQHTPVLFVARTSPRACVCRFACKGCPHAERGRSTANTGMLPLSLSLSLSLAFVAQTASEQFESEVTGNQEGRRPAKDSQSKRKGCRGTHEMTDDLSAWERAKNLELKSAVVIVRERMLNLELRWIEGYDRLHFNEGKILPIAWNMSKYYTNRSETKLINFTFY